MEVAGSIRYKCVELDADLHLGSVVCGEVAPLGTWIANAMENHGHGAVVEVGAMYWSGLLGRLELAQTVGAR